MTTRRALKAVSFNRVGTGIANDVVSFVSYRLELPFGPKIRSENYDSFRLELGNR